MYTPGASNVWVTVLTCPGMTMTLTLVSLILKPWITSGELTLNVTVAPAGTRTPASILSGKKGSYCHIAASRLRT